MVSLRDWAYGGIDDALTIAGSLGPVRPDCAGRTGVSILPLGPRMADAAVLGFYVFELTPMLDRRMRGMSFERSSTA